MIKKKICLVGAFAVGKTSLVQRYVHSIFSEKYHTTVGVKIDQKEMTVDGRNINLIIWDLHGEDDFQSVPISYLRGASGCIFVADGTRPATLDIVIALQKRVTEAIGTVPSILAVNKFDLHDQWEMDLNDIKPLVGHNCDVLETSAKTGNAVETAFQRLATMMMEKQ